MEPNRTKSNFNTIVTALIFLCSFLIVKAQTRQEINAQQEVLRMEKAVELSESQKREVYNLIAEFDLQKQVKRKENKGNHFLMQEEIKSISTEYNRRLKEIIGNKKYKEWSKYKKEHPKY